MPGRDSIDLSIQFTGKKNYLWLILKVETYREMVYSTLEEHCRANYLEEPSRFAKLLLRLPALRSIGLKCAEHTFFYRLIKEDRPTFANADLRALDGGTGIYDQRNPLDSFMHAILDDI